MTSHEPSNEDLMASLDRALSGVGRLIAGVEADQWSAPTPCAGWDVRALVDHLASSSLNVAALVRDEPRPDRSPEQVTGDPVAAYRSATATMRAAFAEPGVLEQVYQSPIGPVPGSVIVHLRISELLIHGWDIARATGQPTDLDPELGQETLAWAREKLPPRLRGEEGSGLPFGPEVPVPDDAPLDDRLAAFFGRDPRG